MLINLWRHPCDWLHLIFYKKRFVSMMLTVSSNVSNKPNISYSCSFRWKAFNWWNKNWIFYETAIGNAKFVSACHLFSAVFWHRISLKSAGGWRTKGDRLHTNNFSFNKVTRFSICIGLKSKILFTIKPPTSSCRSTVLTCFTWQGKCCSCY